MSRSSGSSVLRNGGLSVLGRQNSPAGSTLGPSRSVSLDVATALEEKTPISEESKPHLEDTRTLGEDLKASALLSLGDDTETEIQGSKLATEFARLQPSDASELETHGELKVATPDAKQSPSNRREHRNLVVPDAPKERCIKRLTGKNARQLTIDSKISTMLDTDADGGYVLSNCRHPAGDCFTPGLVASIWGKATETDLFQPYFSGKAMNFDNNARFSVLPHSIGVHCQRGQKPHSPNQDDFFVLERQEWLCSGVMDGHGQDGHHISHYVQERLPKLLFERYKPVEDWNKSACGAFKDVVGELRETMLDKASASGTTASVVLLTREKETGPMRLQCAFVGDSSIIYARRPLGGSGPWDIRQLGTNHKPDRPDEQERIESVGGKVRLSHNAKYPARLICETGGLAMSRSLGDLDAVKVGLSAEPEIPPEISMTEDYDHMILICSDGIWDMIEPAAAVQVVQKFAPEDSQRAAEKLANKAQSRWQEAERDIGVVDDITVIIVRPSFVPRSMDQSIDKPE